MNLILAALSDTIWTAAALSAAALVILALFVRAVWQPPEYVGEHRTDTAEFRAVPDGWMPPVGERRIAAMLGETKEIEPS